MKCTDQESRSRDKALCTPAVMMPYLANLAQHLSVLRALTAGARKIKVLNLRRSRQKIGIVVCNCLGHTESGREGREGGHRAHREVTETELVSWCFEPSQPQRITSGLKQRQTDRQTDRQRQREGGGLLGLTSSDR